MPAKTRNQRNIRYFFLKILVIISILGAGISFFQVLLFKYVNPPMTTNMITERISHHCFETKFVEPTYIWKDLNQISPHLRQAVLASEDQRFLHHRGFDYKEIQIVLMDVLHRKGIRGASTISMQAARSLFLPATRNPLRKIAEIWYTLLIEMTWDKKRILSVYLNTVDWGTGLVGAEAGARKYFKCSAKKLTPSQAAMMTAILPSPHRWSPIHPSPWLKKRHYWILNQMKSMPLL